MKQVNLTLCLITVEDKILLGYKKRGFGEGLWNGFGGKVCDSETVEEAAWRELQEEAGIKVAGLVPAGELTFLYTHQGEKFCVTLFRGEGIVGDPVETEEMKPEWFLLQDIPYDSMWADDKFWLPIFLEGKYFKGTFEFDKDYQIIDHKIIVGEK